MKAMGTAGDSSNLKMRTFSKVLNDSQKNLDGFAKAQRAADKAIGDSARLIQDSGKVLGDFTPAVNDAGKATGIFTGIADGLTSVLNTSVPLVGTLGAGLAALPAIVFLVVGAVVTLTDVLGTMIAVVADFVAPLTIVAGLLGGLGAAFAYVAVQSFKNKASLQDQKDALLALHVAQQTYNQDLAKYGKGATQTENALLALHKAQDVYAKAQMGVALGAVNLDEKFSRLVSTLSRRFQPEIIALAQSAGKALSFLNQIAKLPLDQAFRQLATKGVRLLGQFVDGVAKVVARPIRLAFQIAFSTGNFSNMVSDWWRRLSDFLFGYTSHHRMNLPLDHQFAPLTTSHVNGIFQPLINWFNRHHFTKQGQEIGHSILRGFTSSGASQRLGQFIVSTLKDSAKIAATGVLNALEGAMSSLLTKWRHLLSSMGISNEQMIAHAKAIWQTLSSTAGHVWQTIQNVVHRVISTITGWWNSLVRAVESVINVHISWPSPPSWFSGLASGITSHIPGMGATGGIVTRPTFAMIGEAGPEAVIPLDQTPGSYPLSRGMGGGNLTIEVHNHGSVIMQEDFKAAVRDAIQQGLDRGYGFRGLGNRRVVVTS